MDNTVLKRLFDWKLQIEKDIAAGCSLSGIEVLENVRNELQSLILDIMEDNRKIWYTESWNETDIEDAMEEVGVEPTAENIQKVKKLCKGYFGDLSDRNECLRMIIEENCE